MLIMKFLRLIYCVAILKLIGVLDALLSECHNGSGGPFGACTCIPGFTGYNCSLRVCPSFEAWADFPSSDNVAHASYTECSNMVRRLVECFHFPCWSTRLLEDKHDLRELWSITVEPDRTWEFRFECHIKMLLTIGVFAPYQNVNSHQQNMEITTPDVL